MYNNHDNCSAEWCFKTRASAEGKEYNKKHNAFYCKENFNQVYNILKNTIFPFQTDEVMRESLHMFDTKNNESTNNAIKYIETKNKTMIHIMRLNNRISCVEGISIFKFKKYWHTYFNLMELNMSPTFKQLLPS